MQIILLSKYILLWILMGRVCGAGDDWELDSDDEDSDGYPSIGTPVNSPELMEFDINSDKQVKTVEYGNFKTIYEKCKNYKAKRGYGFKKVMRNKSSLFGFDQTIWEPNDPNVYVTEIILCPSPTPQMKLTLLLSNGSFLLFSRNENETNWLDVTSQRVKLEDFSLLTFSETINNLVSLEKTRYKKSYEFPNQIYKLEDRVSCYVIKLGDQVIFNYDDDPEFGGAKQILFNIITQELIVVNIENDKKQLLYDPNKFEPTPNETITIAKQQSTQQESTKPEDSAKEEEPTQQQDTQPNPTDSEDSTQPETESTNEQDTPENSTPAEESITQEESRGEDSEQKSAQPEEPTPIPATTESSYGRNFTRHIIPEYAVRGLKTPIALDLNKFVDSQYYKINQQNFDNYLPRNKYIFDKVIKSRLFGMNELIWEASDTLHYSLMVHVNYTSLFNCTKNVTVFMVNGENKTLCKTSNGWSEIDKLTLDISKTQSTDQFDYSVKKDYTIYKAKTGYYFKEIINSYSDMIYKSIWRGEKDLATEVRVHKRALDEQYIIVFLKSKEFLIFHRIGDPNEWHDVTSRRFDMDLFKFYDAGEDEIKSKGYVKSLYHLSYGYFFKLGVKCFSVKLKNEKIYNHLEDQWLGFIRGVFLDLINNKVYIMDLAGETRYFDLKKLENYQECFIKPGPKSFPKHKVTLYSAIYPM
uniref:SfiI-subtelomeric related protein family member n=1 Tax=Theileria annulata TaxID=5874 RepID=A0A3B0MSJ6_THEAN